MKYLLGMLLTLVLSLAVGQTVPVKQINWQPLIDFHYIGGKVYFDVNSLGTGESKIGKFNYGNILVVSEFPSEVTVGKQKFKATSLVMSLVIECKSGIMTPAMNIYYANAMPTATDIPLKIFQYSDSSLIMKLSEHSQLRTALCPTYI